MIFSERCQSNTIVLGGRGLDQWFGLEWQASLSGRQGTRMEVSRLGTHRLRLYLFAGVRCRSHGSVGSTRECACHDCKLCQRWGLLRRELVHSYILQMETDNTPSRSTCYTYTTDCRKANLFCIKREYYVVGTNSRQLSCATYNFPNN